jgi:1,4-dihydroxy-2-naphthoate octaprenyltransferase
VLAYATVGVLAVTGSWWAALAFGSLPLAARPTVRVLGEATGRALIPVLRDTGIAELAFAALLTIGLAVG